MASVPALLFARKYPFTGKAKTVVSENNFSLETIPESVVQRAALMISYAAKRKPYVHQEITESAEILTHEILAFPVAKILLSCINNSYLNEKFASMVAKAVFHSLEFEEDRTQAMLDLAQELDAEYALSDDEHFFVKLPLHIFLKQRFRESFSKLVNQSLDQGTVYLHGNDFARFLSELVFIQIHSSLPVETKNIPPTLKDLARQLDAQLQQREKKAFQEVSHGKVSLNALPPCIQHIYDDLLEGKKVQHLARYHFATFTASIGMPIEHIIQLYSKTPNYNERTTRYQVERIAGVKGGTKYSPSSCAKLISHKLCYRTEECNNITHPNQLYYRKTSKSANQEKENKKQDIQS